MNKIIKVMKLEECVESIKQMIKCSTLIPVIGSGFSAGSRSNNGCVPTGKQMKSDMIEALAKSGHIVDSKSKSFSQVAKYYNRLIEGSIRKEAYTTRKISPPWVISPGADTWAAT